MDDDAIWTFGLWLVLAASLIVWASNPIPVVQKSVRSGAIVACATKDTGWRFQSANTGACDGIETAELEWVP
jgi:hypothetical protein